MRPCPQEVRLEVTYMRIEDLDKTVARWIRSLRHASASIQADAFDALDRSFDTVEFLYDADAALRQVLAECETNLRQVVRFSAPGNRLRHSPTNSHENSWNAVALAGNTAP